MTTELASRRIVVSWLLTSLCLRYDIAKPSIWLCRKACKRLQFNNFGSDYPLNLTCFGFRYSSVVAKWHVRTFLALRPEGRNSVRKVSHSWSRSRGNIDSPGTDVASVLLIRMHCRSSPSRGRPLRTSFPSLHAGHVPRTDTFRRVAAREHCLNLHRKGLLNRNTVARLTAAQVGYPSRTLCRRVRPTRLTRTTCRRASWCARRNGERWQFYFAHSRVGNQCRRGVGATEHKSTRDRKEPIMYRSRGAISFTPLFTTDDIGLREDATVEHVVKGFLTVGEAMAARWIEMPRVILLLQAVPDQPASGAIYLYDRERHIFFFVDFVDGRDDTMTAAEFDQLVAEYDLVSWTANPAFLPAGVQNPGMA